MLVLLLVLAGCMSAQERAEKAVQAESMLNLTLLAKDQAAKQLDQLVMSGSSDTARIRVISDDVTRYSINAERYRQELARLRR